MKRNESKLVKIKKINSKNIHLIYFDFPEDSYYNFIENDNTIIFSNEDSLFKTKLVRELKDYDHDGIIDYIEKFIVCEAGCMSEKKFEIIYEITLNSVLVKNRTPVENNITR